MTLDHFYLSIQVDGLGVAMGPTALISDDVAAGRLKIAGVVKWAQQVGCFNVAAELNEVLALLRRESEEAPPKRRRRA